MTMLKYIKTLNNRHKMGKHEGIEYVMHEINIFISNIII